MCVCVCVCVCACSTVCVCVCVCVCVHCTVQSHSKSSTEAEKENGASVSDKLQRRIAPFMMRRTKAEVMEEQDKLQVSPCVQAYVQG